MRRHVLRDTVVVFITAGYSGKKCACSCPCLPMARTGHDAVALLSQLPGRHGSSCERANTCSREGASSRLRQCAVWLFAP